MAYSVNGIVLVEEFFAGREVVPIGFVSDFRYTHLGTHHLLHFELPGMFIIRQSMFPAAICEELLQRVIELNSRLFESYAPAFGIAFGQYRVNEVTGEIRLMESAIRGPAGYISSHLIPLTCGIDVVPLLLELVTGRRKSAAIDSSNIQNRSAAKLYFYLPAGIIDRIRGLEEVHSLPGVEKVGIDDLEVGMPVKELTNEAEKYGPVIITGKDAPDCEKIVGQIKRLLKIDIKTPQGMKGIVWN
jgi:hypothetical protein